MRPFDLEEAKAGKPIQYRDGDAKVTFVGTEAINGNVIIRDDNDELFVYPVTGKCPFYCVEECGSDLVMAYEKKIQIYTPAVQESWDDTTWVSLEAAKSTYPENIYREVEV